MGIDIRTPIGLMFAIIGGLLVIYGMMTPPEMYARSLNTNVNLYWGLVLLVVGITFMLLARRRAARLKRINAR